MKKTVRCIILFALVVVLATPATAFFGIFWEKEEIDRTKPYLGTSLAIDASNNPHICYHNDDSLKYAHWDGFSWQMETIVTVADKLIEDFSLTLDSNDNPHICYAVEFGIQYLHWDGSAWQIETVDNAETYCQYLSFVLDSNDNPHIAYQDGNTLKYAGWDGSAWQIEAVGTIGESAEYEYKPSLKLDIKDNPHICYYSDDGLKYARRDEFSWQMKTIATTMDKLIEDFSLALDSNDCPHICYVVDFGIQYLHWDGSAWQIERNIHFSFPIYGFLGHNYVSITLDSRDSPHICLFSAIWPADWDAHCVLKYFYRKPSGWHREIVDRGINVGYRPSFSLDGNDLPHISYTVEEGPPLYHPHPSLIKYAHRKIPFLK